jgi:hypothetical protein
VDFDGYNPRLCMSTVDDGIKRDQEDKEFDKLHEAQFKVFVEREAKYVASKGKEFSLILVQCHKVLQSKFMARANYEQKIKGDPIELLKAIKEHTVTYMENNYDAAII